ncbi:hypothetical protein MMC15_001805, partial [Xylographa vitiligo]|nr:hypothetical protein [Xylographa vitiligo]
MDIFSTTITVVQEIYTNTVFVQGVVLEMKGYEENVSDIQAKLEHEFIFLETFKALFFDENDSFQQYKSLPLNLTRDVDNILLSLKKCLAQYGLLAAKHGLNQSEPLALIQLTETAIAEAPTMGDPAEPRNGFRGRLKASFQTLKKKLEPLDWALFSKYKIVVLLKDYSEWTERRRQVMTLMLLVAGSIKDSTKKELVGKPVGAALRLDE